MAIDALLAEDELLCVDLDAEGRVPCCGPLDYGFRACDRFLALDDAELERLVRDAATADSLLHPKTFFLRADEPPSSGLEALARHVFERHAPRGRGAFDRRASGAEWWVQWRDAHDDDAGVPFHFDKDEELCTLAATYVHPHLSTVTYLRAECGAAPTVVLERAERVDGRVERGPIARAWLSAPRARKHVCFDGRLLHGAPAAFGRARAGVDAAGRRGAAAAAAPRVTFLVNIWLNHRPLGVARFPQASGAAAALRIDAPVMRKLLRRVPAPVMRPPPRVVPRARSRRGADAVAAGGPLGHALADAGAGVALRLSFAREWLPSADPGACDDASSVELELPDSSAAELVSDNT